MSIDPLHIGFSGLEAAQTQLDVAAKNVANLGTAGFRATGTPTEAAPGALPTGNPTDVASTGPSFFALANPTGGPPTYTSAGNFAVDANGELVDTASGFPVTGTDGAPIAVPPGTTGFTVAADGTVGGTLPNGQTATFGQIALATFANPEGLTPIGGGYQASAASGPAQAAAPASGAAGSLLSGMLESSNVDLADEMVKMMAAQIAFEANATTVHVADQNLETILKDDEPEEGAAR